MQGVLRIPKSSGTSADVLLTFGVVRLLDRWLWDWSKRGDIEVQDKGAYFEIRVLDTQGKVLKEIPDPKQAKYFSSPAYYLTIPGFYSPPDPNFPYYDVEDLERRQRFFYGEYRRLLQDKEIDSFILESQLRDLEPPLKTNIALFLSDSKTQALKSGQHKGPYLTAVEQWTVIRCCFGEGLKILFDMAQGTDSEKWSEFVRKENFPKPQITASQILNPHQGQGQNYPKQGNIDARKRPQNPWPLQYLKATGLWEVAIPRQVVVLKGSRRRSREEVQGWKVYVPVPRSLRLRHLRRIYRQFSRAVWREIRGKDTTALKMDITSILLFYKTWLNFAQRESQTKPIIHGFHVVHYVPLHGRSYTMLNQSFLRLPTWADAVTSWADVKAWQALIDEHLDVIHAVDETHSDGYDMLKDYRDFVAGGKWEGFFAFTTAYAHYAMQRMIQQPNLYTPLFTTPNLRRLLMTEKRFTPILESEGFRNFAYAIRHSTVWPQYWKAQYKRGEVKEPPLYEVRYGLGEELKRKAAVEEEFIIALMGFAQSYNRENAQVLERIDKPINNEMRKRLRRDLRTSDIEEMVRLVDEYGSEVVAHLLVAYGYAREPREEGNGE